MITLKYTNKGLEVKRFLPFIIFGNEEGRASSSSNCPALPFKTTEKGGKHGNIK